MKFAINNGKDFFDALSKVMTVAPRKSHLEDLCTIKFEAANDHATISASNLQQFIKVCIPAQVIESGEIRVGTDDLAKISAFTGKIIIDTFGGKFSVVGNKKYRAVPLYESDENDVWPKFPDGDMELKCEMSEKELLSAMVATDRMRHEDYAVRPLYTGFNINCQHQRMAATDGFRFTIKKICGNWFTDKGYFTLPWYSFQSMKKIINAKSEDMVQLSVGTMKSSSIIKISGNGFTYWCLQEPGEYMDIEQIKRNAKRDFGFTVKASDVAAIAKEYYNELRKGKIIEKIPLIIFKNEDGVFCSINSANYSSIDQLDVTDDTTENFCFCINPVFLMDSAALFGKDDIRVELESKTGANECNIGLLSMKSGEDLSSYILPVNPSYNVAARVAKLYESMRN